MKHFSMTATLAGDHFPNLLLPFLDSSICQANHPSTSNLLFCLLNFPIFQTFSRLCWVADAEGAWNKELFWSHRRPNLGNGASWTVWKVFQNLFANHWLIGFKHPITWCILTSRSVQRNVEEKATLIGLFVSVWANFERIEFQNIARKHFEIPVESIKLNKKDL